MATQIATWFVADTAEEATFLPQVLARSDAVTSQAIYWRCAVVFFASSLAVNPLLPHRFYTNVELPVIDGFDVAEAFARWGVAVTRLPAAHRLPAGTVTSWGNQFYVFDIVRHFVEHQDDERLVLLDSDCVWRRSAALLGSAIDRHGALTYPLDFEEHAEGEAINGLSRAGLARFARAHGAMVDAGIAYCGGEILALRRELAGRLIVQFDRLWPAVVAGGPDAPREEAHLLSAIYALEQIPLGTASPFIRRMWTTFRHSNLDPADCRLAIWHLPAEKRMGFVNLFRSIAQAARCDPRSDAEAMGLSRNAIHKAMGWPHRSPAKLVRDLRLKLAEKLR